MEKDPVAWKMQQMNYLGMLDRDNLNTIRKHANLTAAQLNKVLYEALIDGMDQTDGAMEKAIKEGAKLRVPKPISQEPVILNILKAYQNQAANILNLTNQTMVKSAKAIYVDVLNRSVADVVAGHKTPDQAIRRTIGMWAEQGVPALVDKAGKKWGAEGYVRTVVNTTMHNTVHKAQDERFVQYGVTLVEVSSHAGARPLCAPYQGRIYSINGSTPKYPNLYTATSYGQPAGLFGINCGHFKYPFIEGVNTQTYFPYNDKDNDIIYKQSQQQRAYERSIRAAKTRLEMYKAMGDDEGVKQATQLIKDRQGKLRDFIDETGRTRRRDREQIVKKVLPAESTPDVATGLQKAKDKADAKAAKAAVPNPADSPHIPQVPTPAPVIPQAPKPAMQARPTVPRIEYVEVQEPQKHKSFLKPGDPVKFVDKDGNEKTGTIKAMYKSGKVNIIADDGSKHQLMLFDDFEHLPQTKKVPKMGNFVNVDNSSAEVKKNDAMFAAMDKKDVFYVTKYTSNYYRQMNRYLRTGRSEGDTEVVKVVENLQRVIKENALPLQDNTMLYRQMGSDALEHMFDQPTMDIINAIKKDKGADTALIEQLKTAIVGGALKDNAFVSSTYIKGSFGSGMDVSIEIFAPKGYRGGVFVDSVSAFQGENEYIFNSGMEFDIIDIDAKADRWGDTNLIFKVIPQMPKASQ
jgi:hypothetical protein